MRSLFGYMAVSVISAIVGFVAIPLSTRLFGQEMLGQLNLLVSIASIAFIVVLLGMDQGYVRLYFDHKEESSKERLLSYSLVPPFIMLIIIWVVFFVYKDWIGAYLGGDPLVIVLALGWLITALVFLRFAICFCRVSNRLALFGCFTVVNVIFSKCVYLCNLGEKTLSTTMEVITWISVTTAVICLIFLGKYNMSFKHLDKTTESISVRDLCRYSIPLMPAMLVVSANAALPLFAVRSSLGFDAAGLYSMTVTVAFVINVVGSGINSFWPTYVFKNYETKQPVIQLFHQVLVVCMFVFATALIMLRFLVPLFLGENYEESASLFAILLISPVCYTVGETAGIGIQIRKKSSYYLVIYTAGMLLNLVLCVMLTQTLGLMGAAVSVALTALLVLALKTAVGNRLYNSTGSLRWLVSSGVLLCLQAIACQLPFDYGVTLAVSLLCLLLFPFAVGVRAFCRVVAEGAGFIRGMFSTKGMQKPN